MPRDVADDQKLRLPLRARLSTQEKAALRVLCVEQGLNESQVVRRLIRIAVGFPVEPDPALRLVLEQATAELHGVTAAINRAVRAARTGSTGFSDELSQGLVLVSRIVATMQRTHALILAQGRERLVAHLDQVEG